MGAQWTRRQLLAQGGAAAAGVVGLGTAGYVGYRWPHGAPAAAHTPAAKRAAAATGGDVHHFVSRPDLTPPRITVSRPPAGSGAPGQVFVAPVNTPGQAGLMICDQGGHPVWFSPAAAPARRMDFTTQTYRGQPVLTWWEGRIVHGIGHGTCFIAGSTYQTIATVQAGHGLTADLHEFVITPRDTALITAYRRREADLSGLGGPAHGYVLSGVAQEIDIATGAVLFEWDSLDHVDVTETEQALAGGTAGKPFDYFHINSLAVMPDGDLLISARNTWTVYKVSRARGTVAWRLGGRRSSFAMGPGTRFYWQHHARPHGGTLLSIFDDGAAPPEEKQSRAIFVSLDLRAMRARLARAYTHPAGLRAAAMGDVQVLPGGRVFVGWGAEPYFSEFTPGGQLILDGQFPAGGHSYRAFLHPWVGNPAEPPAAAARRSPDGGTLVYASWNGATRVEGWSVLAGTSPTALVRAGSQGRTGFETVIAVTSTGPWFAVEATDSRGRTLGRSGAVRAGASLTARNSGRSGRMSSPGGRAGTGPGRGGAQRGAVRRRPHPGRPGEPVRGGRTAR